MSSAKNNKYIRKGEKSTSAPYLLGLLGFIPLVGLFVGVGLILYGILKYKDKMLTIIGIACVLFSLGVYTTLFHIGSNPKYFKELWEENAQIQMNSLIRDIEFYKLKNGFYPDSLTQLENDMLFLFDPIQTTQNGVNIYYNFENLGDTYLLFSSGIDGVPHTADDIFPQSDLNDNLGWVQTKN